MITIDDIGELVDDLSTGALLWGEAYPVLLRMVGRYGVAPILERLPAPLCSRFASDLRRDFSNVGTVEVLWVDNAGEPSDKVEIIEAVTAWLAQSPE